MIRKVLLASTLLAVVSAGAVTIKQLNKAPKLFPGCRGTCSATQPCTSGPCFCYIPSGTSGFCVQDPPGARKK